MPESLNIDTKSVESDAEYPVSITVRQLLPEGSEISNGSKVNGSHISNGMFRSNLTADTTDSMLAIAKANEATETEIIHAKYVVGCDGAHSWVRRQIGCVMEGEHTDFIWCVVFLLLKPA